MYDTGTRPELLLQRSRDDNICLTAVYSAEFIPILIASIEHIPLWHQPLTPQPCFYLSELRCGESCRPQEDGNQCKEEDLHL